jgi:hypothetical protein
MGEHGQRIVALASAHRFAVIAAHRRPKDGVASLDYDAAIHSDHPRTIPVRFSFSTRLMDARVKPAHDQQIGT